MVPAFRVQHDTGNGSGGRDADEAVNQAATAVNIQVN